MISAKNHRDLLPTLVSLIRSVPGQEFLKWSRVLVAAAPRYYEAPAQTATVHDRRMVGLIRKHSLVAASAGLCVEDLGLSILLGFVWAFVHLIVVNVCVDALGGEHNRLRRLTQHYH